MGHGHLHPGESVSGYFTEQLLTILVVGLLGAVGVLMYAQHLRDLDEARVKLEKDAADLERERSSLTPEAYQEKAAALQNRQQEFDRGQVKTRLSFLATSFQKPLLWGGVAVLIMVAVRAVAVWKEAGELLAQARADADAGTPVCGVDHVHTADCAHDTNIGGGQDHAHDHTHSHDMSWMFARTLILIFPVGLYFLGLPSPTLGQDELLKRAKGGEEIKAAALKEQAKDAAVIEEKPQPDGSVVRLLKTKTGLKIRSTTPAGGGEPTLSIVTEGGAEVRFNDLNDAALDTAKRENWAGQTAILEGRFTRLSDKEFTLFRQKMACCITDTVTLKVRIIVPQAVNGLKEYDWVRVKGQIQFYKVPGAAGGAEQYIPVLMVADIKDVRKSEPKSDYEQ